MIESRLGEFAALATALCWTLSAVAFEIACKRVGPMAVNWLRLAMGFILLSLFCWFSRGLVFPVDASGHTWLWLAVSGVVGFALGDLFLLRAFTIIGSRISMLVMASVPPITALIGWAIMGETLGVRDLLGMTLTVGGIVFVVTKRKPGEEKKKVFSHSLQGVLLALGGAVGQAVGLVLSKYGMGSYNAFAATQIRILAGVIGLSVILFFLKGWLPVAQATRDRKSLSLTFVGALFAVFLGVSLSLVAVQHTSTGVASTIMAIVPVLIIPPAIIIFKEKVSFREVFGAVVAVIGVALLFL
jgi:drug/metabolite transporter (DMT)-like permease